jgi:hypothetical protein
MQIVLSSDEEVTLNIVIMAKQYAFCIFVLVFAEAYMYCCKIEWLFYEPQNFLSMVLAFFALFSQCNTMGLSFCLL